MTIDANGHAILGAEDLDRDGTRGAALTTPPGVLQGTIDCPDLRSIDLFNCPDLETIDLSGCQPGLHVVVADCRALRHLALPADGLGAVLHLDFRERLPQLSATGRVADLTVAWNNDDFPPPGRGTWGAEHGLGPLRGRDRRGPLEGFWIGRPHAPLPDDAEFLILHAGVAASAVTLPARAREVLILDAPGLRTVHLASSQAPLRRLDVCLAADLAELAGPGRSNFVRVEGSDDLTRVDWTGQHLFLDSSGGPSVEVLGPWELVRVVDSEVASFEAGFADRVEIGSCPNLRRLVASPDGSLWLHGAGPIEELIGPTSIDLQRVTLQDILAGAFLGDPNMTRLALEWLGRRHGPSATLDAIQILHACLVKGWAPEQVWEQRCVMHARACSDRTIRDDALGWGWDFPNDLADRGWEADLRLWRICRAAQAESENQGWTAEAWIDPEEYLHTLSAASEPEHLLAFATASARLVAAGDDADDLLGLLLRALDHGVARGGVLGRKKGAAKASPAKQDPAGGVRAVSLDRIRRTLHALAWLRELPEGRRAVSLLAAWIQRRMPYSQGLDLLGSMRDLGSEAATTALAAFASDPTDPDRKQQALALLMKPPTQTLFAFDGADA